MTSVFFKKENDNEVALTSTSANHIANLAREHEKTMQQKLNGISYIKCELQLIDGNKMQFAKGSNIKLEEIEQILNDLAECNSLIAWIREGIKEKEKLYEDLKKLEFKEWCNLNNIKIDQPTIGTLWEEKDFYNSLSIKERNEYYELEAKASTIGKYIHENGDISKARIEIKEKLQNPTKLDQNGRDSILFTFTPKVTEEEFDALYFNLQNKYREYQAQLNHIKNKCDETISNHNNEIQSKLRKDLEEYMNIMKIKKAEFELERNKKLKEIKALKIVIPHSLLNIYNKINGLKGKK